MPRLTSFIPLIFVLIWSTGFIGAKFALPFIEPFLLLVVRYFLVILIVGAALIVVPGTRIELSDAVFQVFVGIFLHGFYLAGVFYAIGAGMPAGSVAVIVGLQPLLTTAIGRYWLQQAVSHRQTIGLVLGLFGVILVVIGAGQMTRGAVSGPGLLATFIALFGISIGTVLQKERGGEVRPRTGLLLQYIGALAVTLPLTLLWETQTVEITMTLLLSLAWLVLGLSILAIWLLLVMIKVGQVARISSYFYLVPPATILQAWLFFGETLTLVSAIGVLAAIVSVYLIT